ncbi:MAG: uroporphyrinogen-III C-methyltransferase, partial [Rhodospirillaceae bacterium]
GLDSLCAAPAETVAEDLEAALTTPVDSAKGSIALVGAGPGDPGLLTLEAAKALRTADVVLHDALVSPEILAMTRKEARVIPVGKRAGQPSVPQDMTNQLMLSHAKRGERVVRLKGGDPFVFGRGGEEQDFLQAHGIQPQVLCGVSAAFGIAARLGLPLTYRGESRALTLATASFDETAGQSGQPDWAKLANPSATLCLYMAGRHMGQAAQALIDHGLTPETPLVGIWDGTGQSHAHHFMTLAQAAEDFATDKTPFGPKETPVLFIIGDAVAHSPASTLSATKVLESRPSAGKVFDHNSVGVAL